MYNRSKKKHVDASFLIFLPKLISVLCVDNVLEWKSHKTKGIKTNVVSFSTSMDNHQQPFFFFSNGQMPK